MANYLTTDTDLTSIANAIRTKGGTQAQLAFPTEFVSAINAIPTGGGGGGLTLLATKSLGAINATNTSGQDTGQTVAVTGLNDYDLMIVETSVDTKVADRHAVTINVAVIYGGTSYNALTTKSGVTIPTIGINGFYGSTTSTLTTKSNTGWYGLYIYNSVTWSAADNGSITLKIYQRYSSTITGTINGNYTTRVYGANLLQLIGG